MNRRDFLQASGLLGAGALIGGAALVSSCGKKAKNVPLREAGTYYIPELPDKASAGKEIRVGVIGCGGRGSGAVKNVFEAADGVKIVALADVFADRLNSLRDKIKENYNQEVPEDKCFIGFDAYKQLIDSGVDYVICTAPPVFRPDHFKYATEKGVHSFLEKPIAVDPKGPGN